jgi:outer membrane lipoprotein LolB
VSPHTRLPVPGTRQSLLAIACTLLLAACTSPLVRDATPAAPRQLLSAFAVEGRLSATDGREAASGRFEWVHAAAHDRLTLYSPLGHIVALLDGGPGGASLQTADGSRREAAGMDALLPEVLGVDLPAARLPRWIQAAPDEDAEVRALDAGGRPLLVFDHGWRIDYPGYADDTAAAVPRRLEISRGDARVRLIIDSWTALP